MLTFRHAFAYGGRATRAGSANGETGARGLDAIDEAVDKKIATVEIIPGKGSGQLKKKVIRFLEQKEIKALYHRIDKDSKNFGRLFVYFQHKGARGKRK